MNNSSYNVIDLFCGCGGMSLGFEKAGFNMLLGIDNWEDALKTYRYNHKNANTLCGDLSTLTPEEVNSKIKNEKIDVIIGGPPCQGFSVAGKRIIEDKRNELYKSFVKMVAYFKPKAFVFENVPNILSIGNGVVRDAIIKDFSELGYKVVYKILLASDYGVPQNRKRAIFVGLLNGNEFSYPKGNIAKPITTREALSDLPEYSIPEGGEYVCPPQSEYQKRMRANSNVVYNHNVTVHTVQTQHIISLVPDGGNYKDLPIELQQTRKVHIAWTRLCSSKPSITIDTGHNHHFHYVYNRVPTVRESARLQSFPDDFIFCGGKTSQLKQVGNAVPPIMAETIATSIILQL
ncbi:MAG: DNA cytosine methyltransferase [Paludibacteraceae bacterium]|nr:DNA cytosine methyltransferase [Paludibacteraceae bacterium]